MPAISVRKNISSDENNDTNNLYNNPSEGNERVGMSESSNDFWSKHHDHVSYDQLEKFWCGLTLQARQKLLRLDKQIVFEDARKNMYCSRCNGFLLEGYLQIVMYVKSIQQDVAGHYTVGATNIQADRNLSMENGFQDDVNDPSVHPWGGLTTSSDGTLTLLDSYLDSESLKGVQDVFDGARAREKERKSLYPDACGGGDRGWISPGMTGYGRGHGTRKTCALHTTRLPVETLEDFWSTLGEETQHSLMTMKEDDFIERLMYRFDSKRFCRDCRRNVIREFKELKELKRMRKDPRCTSWFCAADTAFQYEVSYDTVQADWNQTFLDSVETYHHFEWAIGTGEGKSDILEFENVGLSVRVQVNGLDLGDLKACYITLRAWKINGRCNELCVKAHALQGQHCVHCRLVVGDGFITITRGASIRSFFEHAEEAEEEEDDDSADKDGNEFDGECSRPQKHAKSPELAREFLLDAATVIFKEQIEKAFREGTTRKNAYSVFVCLALKLLEVRLHVACKEISTLEKQMKLIEEEEKEKQEKRKEEERKERKKTKGRGKKLRKKERLREKENKEKRCVESNVDSEITDASVKDSTGCPVDNSSVIGSRVSISEAGEATTASPLSSDIQYDQLLTEYIYTNMEDYSEDNPNVKFDNTRDWDTSYSYDHPKFSHRNLKFHKVPQHDWNLKWSDRRKGESLLKNGTMCQADDFEFTRSTNGFHKQIRCSIAKYNTRIPGNNLGEKFQCPHNREGGKYHSHSCRCNHHDEHKPRPASCTTRVAREPKYVNKLESRFTSDISKPYYSGNQYTQVEDLREVNGWPKSKIAASKFPSTKKVWEPLNSQKKYVRSNSDSDFTLRSTPKVEVPEFDQLQFSGTTDDVVTDISVSNNHVDDDNSVKCSSGNGLHEMAKSDKYSKKAVSEDCELTLDSSTSNSSNSDNCSSCLSEGDSITQNLELTSASDSEEFSQNSEGRDHNTTKGNDAAAKIQEKTCARTDSSNHLPKEMAPHIENGRNVSIVAPPQNVLPQMLNQSLHYPIFQAPAMGYYHQSPGSWAVGHASGLLSFPQSNHYLFPNNGFGYGLNGNAQYLQQLAPPLINAAHLPVFQTVPSINGASSTKRESLVAANAGELQHKVALSGQHPKPPRKMEKGSDDGFSLFHFGGPVALSAGFEVGPISLEGDVSPRKDSVEEYNLFDASNGIKFSFF